MNRLWFRVQITRNRFFLVIKKLPAIFSFRNILCESLEQFFVRGYILILSTKLYFWNGQLRCKFTMGQKSSTTEYLVISRSFGISIVCSPTLSGCGGGEREGGLRLQPNFQKRRAWQDLFRRWLLGKRGWLFSGEGCSFYIKNKLKFEIFNDKNIL